MSVVCAVAGLPISPATTKAARVRDVRIELAPLRRPSEETVGPAAIDGRAEGKSAASMAPQNRSCEPRSPQANQLGRRVGGLSGGRLGVVRRPCRASRNTTRNQAAEERTFPRSAKSQRHPPNGEAPQLSLRGFMVELSG